MIEFWFDLGSPYAYFAAREIDALAARHGRAAVWRPFLLGAVFRTTGNRPLLEQPLKGDYIRRDWERLARRAGIPWRLPERAPISGVAASRAFYSLDDQDPEAARRFARAAFEACYVEGRDLGDPAEVAAVWRAQGLDPAALEAALADPAVKDRLRRRTAEAEARGIFGSPLFIVDGEPFWGHDRMPMLEEWLARGGW
ncbi:MAG TPA: 2-hydroxychromene-2-carboxylate isomerase [Alphaproteobacteria bacterium]|nr:2-hydroxychromene-2-carboxylate isomerase [Alphaproteobacteria bacterium]